MKLSEYLSLLPSAHGDKPKLRAFLTSVLTQVNDLDALRGLRESSFDPFNAVGEQLDTLGSLLGVERDKLEDADYRLVLLGRIAHRVWDGRLSTLRELLPVLFPAYPFSVTDEEGMHLRVTAPATLTSTQKRLLENHLLVPKPLGVSVTYVYT